jgi:hypothetical protein
MSTTQRTKVQRWPQNMDKINTKNERYSKEKSTRIKKRNKRTEGGKTRID